MNTTQALQLLDQVTAQISLPRPQHQQIQSALQTLAMALQPPVLPPQPKVSAVKNPAEPPETK